MGAKTQAEEVVLARDSEGTGSQGEGREKIQKTKKLRHEVAGLGQVWRGPRRSLGQPEEPQQDWMTWDQLGADGRSHTWEYLSGEPVIPMVR